MIKDWNFWVSLITASAAIIALRVSYQQIKSSNKQQLFDKRLENYIIASGLIQLYREHEKILKHEENTPIMAIEMMFAWLTNNSYLQLITPAINNPLKGESHKEFLIKLEDLKEVAIKIKYLFLGKDAIWLSDFVLYYKELLYKMYQYKICLDHLVKVAQEEKISLEKAQLVINEEEMRAELLEALEKLKQADLVLIDNNVEDQIDKQIKL